MVEPILSSPEVTVFVLATAGSGLLLAGKMYREQTRLKRRLEGDESDQTQPGFFVETNRNFEQIESRLDEYDDRFDHIDQALEEIADHIEKTGDGDGEFSVGKWSTNGSDERESSRLDD